MGVSGGKDFVCGYNEVGHWFSAKTLCRKATTSAKYLGKIKWIKSNPLTAFIVLIRGSKKRRTVLTYTGKKRQSKIDKVYAKRQKEPWLLVASLSLHGRMPEQIVKFIVHGCKLKRDFEIARRFIMGWVYHKKGRLMLCFRVLFDQQLNQRVKQGFSPSTNIVDELEETQIKRKLLL